MKYRGAIVTAPLSSARQTGAVLDAVRRADLRRQRRLALHEGLIALLVALGILSVLALVRLVVPVAPLVWWLGSGLAVLPAAVAAVRAARRQADALAGAAELDRAAALDDTLTTATWFATTPADDSVWIEAQHARAADAAAPLDVDALIPVAPPLRLRQAAGALVVLLVVALLVPASWSRRVIGLDPGPTFDMAASGDQAAGEAGASAEDPDAPMSTEELLAAAEQGLRSGAGMTESGAGAAEGEARAGAGTDAGGEAAPGEVPDVTGSGPPPANAERGDLDEGERGEGRRSESLQDALDRAADEARDAAAAAEAAAEEGGPEGEKDESGTDSEGGGTGGGESGAGAPTEAEAEGAMPGGHLSGPGGGEAADGMSLEAARAELAITLKREQLTSRFAALAASDDTLIERQSEVGESRLSFQDVAPAARYQGSAADPVRPVPWAYQELVRKYFLERARQERKDPR